MKFQNRIEAGQLLVELLERHHVAADIILAIPRGGIVIGSILSRALNIPMDVWLCKKIGHPEHTEYAIGSVCADGTVIQNNALEPETQSYFDRNAGQLQSWLQKRMTQLTGRSSPADVSQKNVLLVDDGVATGSTMLAAIQSIRNYSLKNVFVAVPVAATAAASRIKQATDGFYCLHTADRFQAVGEFYESFEAVTDEQAQIYLRLTANKTILL
jgi:putative phosphoribosyl transferase